MASTCCPFATVYLTGAFLASKVLSPDLVDLYMLLTAPSYLKVRSAEIGPHTRTSAPMPAMSEKVAGLTDGLSVWRVLRVDSPNSFM